MIFCYKNTGFAVAKGRSNQTSPQVWSADPAVTNMLQGKTKRNKLYCTLWIMQCRGKIVQR